MKSKYTSLLYFFIVALVLIGLSILFLRQSFVNFLREETGVAAIDVAVRKSLPAGELIDTEILEGARLNSLKDNVKVFSFEEICGDSVNALVKCVRGNNNPFLKK